LGLIRSDFETSFFTCTYLLRVYYLTFRLKKILMMALFPSVVWYFNRDKFKT